MNNPLLENLVSGNNNNAQMAQRIQQIKGLMNQVKTAQNPQLMLNQLISSNPQLQNALNFIKQNGGDPQTAFFNFARQQGVNPQDILNLLK